MARQISRSAGSPAVPWVFDLRGQIAEEYVDAGHWRRGGLRHRITAAAERRLLEQAHGLVTLTHRIVERLPQPVPAGSARPAAVIPCSADLAVFRPSEPWRDAVRGELGLGQEPVLVYSGSLGSWYRLDEMLDFFEQAARTIRGLRFLLLTPQAGTATKLVQARGLTSRVMARTLAPDAVPRYLAAADAGICFLGQHGSKVASSPTKYAEYLASGLPVITNSWIGDAARLAGQASWILVDEFSGDGYRKPTARLAELLAAPTVTRTAARSLAEHEFALETAVERYHALYRRVLDR
jgi:glycosyltransferase involved in cell wall biosynthesis